MSFGEALRELRRSKGVSQRELANQTNLDFSYISKLENGKNPPPAADTIVKICDVLGVPPETLLAMTGKIPSDIQQTISSSPAAQEFLREAQQYGLQEPEWRALREQIKYLKG